MKSKHFIYHLTIILGLLSSFFNHIHAIKSDSYSEGKSHFSQTTSQHNTVSSYADQASKSVHRPRHLRRLDDSQVTNDKDSLTTTDYNDTTLATPHHNDPILRLHHHARMIPQCGVKWQKEYHQLHHQIESGHPNIPKRYFIHISGGQGANDRLTGILTGFLIALLSNRAYKVLAYNEVPDFLDNFDTPIVDLRVDDKTKEHLLPQIHNKSLDHYNFNFTSDIHFAYYFDGVPILHRDASNESLSAIFGDSPETVLFMSNRGNTYHILKDSIYSTVLDKYQIHPAYGAYCIFNYLFRPKNELLEYAKPLSDPMADPNTVKIGIQIRVGDYVFDNPYTQFLNNTAYFQNFFICAEYLEQQILQEQPHKKVIWYLLSDSFDLRLDAKQKYGGKLITNTVDRAMHSGNKDGGLLSLRSLLAEELVLALCDYFVISHNSGVGRMGSWLSRYGGDNNRTYTENRYHEIKSTDKRCPSKPPAESIANAGAGL